MPFEPFELKSFHSVDSFMSNAKFSPLNFPDTTLGSSDLPSTVVLRLGVCPRNNVLSDMRH